MARMTHTSVFFFFFFFFPGKFGDIWDIFRVNFRLHLAFRKHGVSFPVIF